MDTTGKGKYPSFENRCHAEGCEYYQSIVQEYQRIRHHELQTPKNSCRRKAAKRFDNEVQHKCQNSCKYKTVLVKFTLVHGFDFAYCFFYFSVKFFKLVKMLEFFEFILFLIFVHTIPFLFIISKPPDLTILRIPPRLMFPLFATDQCLPR